MKNATVVFDWRWLRASFCVRPLKWASEQSDHGIPLIITAITLIEYFCFYFGLFFNLFFDLVPVPHSIPYSMARPTNTLMNRTLKRKR